MDVKVKTINMIKKKKSWNKTSKYYKNCYFSDYLLFFPNVFRQINNFAIFWYALACGSYIVIEAVQSVERYSLWLVVSW